MRFGLVRVLEMRITSTQSAQRKDKHERREGENLKTTFKHHAAVLD